MVCSEGSLGFPPILLARPLIDMVVWLTNKERLLNQLPCLCIISFEVWSEMDHFFFVHFPRLQVDHRWLIVRVTTACYYPFSVVNYVGEGCSVGANHIA